MDRDHVDELIALGSKEQDIQRIQDIAAKAMKANGLGYTLHNACAATLSAFMQEAGIDVPMTLGAGRLAERLGGNGSNSRKWQHIAVGRQMPGDVGVTFDDDPTPPGADHIYLVVERVDSDEMLIADNQAPRRHRRYASGRGGKTPTEYFLRAPDEQTRMKIASRFAGKEVIDPENLDFFPWDDEETNDLEEPFDDDGKPSSASRAAKTDKDIDKIADRVLKALISRAAGNR